MLGKIKTLSHLSNIPYYLNYELSRTGECYFHGKKISSAELPINVNNDLLVLLAFQHISIPPIYWSKLIILSDFDQPQPENTLIGIKEPIESLEFPGFYIIPYYSNYVISETGLLIKRSSGEFIQASEAATNYFTYRMVDDSGHVSNQLRHRILGFAFLPYCANVNTLDINHLNGVRGDDRIDNLEWATRSRNMDHAYEHGLRDDNRPVQIRDIYSLRTFIFRSYSAAAEYLGLSASTVSKRANLGDEYVYDGFQYRRHPSDGDWAEIRAHKPGKYVVQLADGGNVRCGGKEAARLLGLTRTSFLRAVREGRNSGKTDNVLLEILNSPDGQ